MKRFILDIFMGLLSFCLIWFAFELAIVHCVQNKYSYKYNYVKGNHAIKTLLDGSSYFENSINPYMLGDSVFDFAINERIWMYWDAELAENLFPTMPNLKTVIFSLGYEQPYNSPHYQPNYLEDLRDVLYKYTKFMNLPYDISPRKYRYYSALLNNKMGLKYWIDEDVDSLGYVPIYGQIPNWEDAHNVTGKIDGDTLALCYNENMKYLIRLAKVCYENDIRFIVVTCPCANCYVQNTSEYGIRKLYNLIDSVAVYYPLEYFNYLDDAEFRADSLYYNSSHLNSIGADMFAVRLKEDLHL